jgi:aminopeptidase-like protein
MDARTLQNQIHKEMHDWAIDLFPFCRSITGEGVRQTLHYIKNQVPQLTIHEVPTGKQVFDWTVPDEWNIKEAYVEDETGKKVIDFKNHNLHILGYSIPIDTWMSLEELDQHLYSIPDMPEAIPYRTSYYERRWGFCLCHDDRVKLKPGQYHVVIKSTLAPGVLNYGELIILGREEKEILLSTYVCHPSMANNEISGPVVATALSRWIMGLKDRRYTYRIVFLPETIGSIAYLSRHLEEMKSRTIAGYVVTCVGDNRAYSFLPSRLGNTLADQVTRHVLKYYAPEYVRYSFLDRGSDERQYCSVGVDLPVVSLMRTRYGDYPEYHTSLDDLSVISPDGLGGAYEGIKKCLKLLENNYNYRVSCVCEPQLSKRGLRPTLGARALINDTAILMHILQYADGNHNLIDLAERIGVSAEDCIPIIERLLEAGLIEKVKNEFYKEDE